MANEHSEDLKGGGKGSITKDGDYLVIKIPNPNNKSPEEVGKMLGHDCSSRCSGLISNASAFVF
jgi:hypothetical protein